MKIEDAYIGLKVKARKHDFHERFPQYFPKEWFYFIKRYLVCSL